MKNRSNPRTRLPVLLATAVFLSACSDSTDEPTGPDVTQPEAIKLPVRMHLTQSDQLQALNTQLTDPEVTELLDAVNEVWAQAGIVWGLERIVREDARNESTFHDALTDPTFSPIGVLTSVLPPDHVRPDIWNVFMIRDFGGTLGGVYLPIEKVVVSTEVDPEGLRDVDGGMARVLAHELGHSPGPGAHRVHGSGQPHGGRVHQGLTHVPRPGPDHPGPATGGVRKALLIPTSAGLPIVLDSVYQYI